MTDRYMDQDYLDKIRQIAYTIIGPQEEERKKMELYFSLIQDPDIKQDARSYFEMAAMAMQL